MQLKRIIPVLLAIALVLTFFSLLSGCGLQEEQTDAAADNRSYMSQANNIAMQLDEDLEPFTEAVANSDIVSMQQAASKVYQDVEDFKALSAPDALKDIHQEYSAGCDDLKEALETYVEVYQKADDEGADSDALNSQIAEAQESYESGIEHLQNADKKVTELNGALVSSSSTAAASQSSAA